jgi:hypothetical protein
MDVTFQILKADTKKTLLNFIHKKEITTSVINLPMFRRTLNLNPLSNQLTRVLLNSKQTRPISTTLLTQTPTHKVTTSREMPHILTHFPRLPLARDQLHFLTDKRSPLKLLIHT